MYALGQGVAQDLVQSHIWLNLAAAQFADGADRRRAVKNRNRVAAKLTPEETAEAQRRARDWTPKTEPP
jgi:TPR repeat protein